MRAALLAFTSQGEALAQRIATLLRGRGDCATATRCPRGGLAAWTRAHFHDDALLFIGSCGIAVRAVAPYLRGKTQDPAVIVVDESAAFVVALLCGHLGGANELARWLARQLNAQAVITTATDRRGVFAVDTWAQSQGLRIVDAGRIRDISGRLLAGDVVTISSSQPLAGAPPAGLRLVAAGGDIRVSGRRTEAGCVLQLAPPVLTLGVGCRRGTDAASVERAFQCLLNETGWHALAVARVCSIDRKANEPGLRAFCRRHGLALQTFSATELAALPGPFTASAFVARTVGVDNVCERAALRGSGPAGRLLARKRALDNVTLALAVSPYPVCFPEEDMR